MKLHENPHLRALRAAFHIMSKGSSELNALIQARAKVWVSGQQR